MPKRRYLNLTEEQKQELEHVRDHHAKAYMREKASALLKVAAGQSPHAVAQNGLLKPRDPDSIYSWMTRYEEKGIEGLKISRGRGRKPSFFPSV